MTRDQIDAAISAFVQYLREVAPKDTGNLAYNAIRAERINDKEYIIYIQVEGEHTHNARDGIAPYQRYINEKPQSRHYKWWERAVSEAIDKLADKLGGDITGALFEGLNNKGGN